MHATRMFTCGAMIAFVTVQLTQANTFVVNSTADPGDGVLDEVESTLREAIDAANANPGRDVITFDIPGAGVQTIRPEEELPYITDSVKIDGTTQPGFDPSTFKPVIELDGSDCVLPNPGWAFGLRIIASNCEVRGLIVNRFSWAGIYVDYQSERCWIAGNFVGTDASGTQALGNGHAGNVSISSDDHAVGGFHRIGGNTAADRNVIAPVYIYTVLPSYYSGACAISTGKDGVVIQGNYIGTDWTGESALVVPMVPGEQYIVRAGIGMLGGDNCMIGGTGPGEGNVISGCRGPNPAEWWQNGSGIELGDNAGTVVQGNRIGTDKDGTDPIPNEIGIRVGGGSVQIGGTEPGAGNLISGNGFDGLMLGSDCIVQGNRIGTDVTGTLPLPNARGGVSVGTHNLVGGSAPGAGNLISGNGSFNLSICGGGYSFNYILGNFIGPDITGTQALPGASAAIGVFLCADDNFIGGSEPGEGNLISGNTTGIDIRNNRNTVKGNLIGTDASGTMPLGNDAGIYLADLAQDNFIGGSEPGAGNVIGDCRSEGYGGIWLNGPNVRGTIIQGNRIGVDRTGSIPLPNHGWGVVVSGNTDTFVGGVNPGEGNVIAHSEYAGVLVSADDFYGVGLRNSIRGNSIYANGWNSYDGAYYWPGIDLGGWLVTPNDVGDTDEGANHLQNYPVLEAASSVATETHVNGSLDSTPNTAFVIDFYANPACDESGFGEGERYLGAVSVTTDGSGQALFNAVLPVAVSTAEVITATATDPEGNTSEFSACSPPIVSVDSDGDGVPDDLDRCPDSDLAIVVIIDGCNTGVPNVITERGCTLADRVAECAEGVRNHVQYVARVTVVALLFERTGLITRAQAAALIRCAVRADIP